MDGFRLSRPSPQFPFGRGDWNLADAYTDAVPHFRRVFFSRFFGRRFRFEWFRNPIGIAFFVVEQKPFVSKLGHKKSYQTSRRALVRHRRSLHSRYNLNSLLHLRVLSC